MSEQLHLVADLALIFMSAGIFTIISKALKQPLILGYILAGFVVGPHLGLFPKMTSMEAVNEWSEIGVVFLLFALGLEFSIKKMMKVGSKALIIASGLCVGMFSVGLAVGNAIGWSSMESIFLGGMMSMSSTTIIIKAYTDLGIKDKPYASIVFGTLVVEDLIAIVLMVLLSTVAISNKFAGMEMISGLAKLAFFLVLSFILGIFVIPTVLKRARSFITDEILLIVSIGLCFLMVDLATSSGFSAALGAFIMGCILSESVEGERIEKLVTGIKDLFGAVFFVSVGMMVDPSVIADHFGVVVLLTVVAMSGIVIIGTSSSLIAGNNIENSVHTGFSLAQLGEFSFIIASLGCSLGVVRDFIYPLIIAVSVITTFTTPYMIKAAAPASVWLSRNLPERLVRRTDESSNDHENTSEENKLWKAMFVRYFLRIGIYSVILIAISLFSKSHLLPFFTKVLPMTGDFIHRLATCSVTVLLMSPFLYGMAVNGGTLKKYVTPLLELKDEHKWPILFLVFLRIMISIAFLLQIITQYFNLSGWVLILIALFGLVLFFWARFSVRHIVALENHFLNNFNEKDNAARMRTPVTNSVQSKLAGYDVHSEIITISPDYSGVGKSLKNQPFRSRTGVNVLKIMRGSNIIMIPSGDERLFPYDKIVVVGTSEQLKSFKSLLDSLTFKKKYDEHGEDNDFELKKIILDKHSPMVDKSLLELEMRRNSCAVISVMRDENLITNPKSDFVFHEGDMVWIAGDPSSCEFYESN